MLGPKQHNGYCWLLTRAKAAVLILVFPRRADTWLGFKNQARFITNWSNQEKRGPGRQKHMLRQADLLTSFNSHLFWPGRTKPLPVSVRFLVFPLDRSMIWNMNARLVQTWVGLLRSNRLYIYFIMSPSVVWWCLRSHRPTWWRKNVISRQRIKPKGTLHLEAMAASIPQKETEKTCCRLNFAQYYL